MTAVVVTRPCSVEDCDRKHVARGWCKRHYRSWQQHGDPLAAADRSQVFTDTHKLCPDCGETKLLAEFSPDSATSSGRATYCKRCQCKRASAGLKRRTTEQIEQARLRRRRRTVERGYGITLEQYDAILAAQGGGCVCGARHPGGRWRHFHVDHDHATGRVRGVLCHGCNTALGLADEDPHRLRVLADYLEGVTQS